MQPDSDTGRLPAPRRLLVRGVNWLGDAVMTTPALERTRERLPDCRISLLTHQKLADLWKSHPAVDQVLTFNDGEGPFAIARLLRRQGFDTALLFPNSPRSALETWLARIPRRIGYARQWRNWFLTQTVPSRPGHVRMRKRSDREIKNLLQGADKPGNEVANAGRYPAGAHQIFDYLTLAAVLGVDPAPLAPRLRIEPAEIETAEKVLRSRLQAGGSTSSSPLFLGLNPAAAYGPAKIWPAERFAAAARAVSQEVRGVVWLIFGGAGEKDLCEQIKGMAAVEAINLAGETTLRQLMACLSICRLLLTNDSGPMHLAAALGTRVVVPFGSTAPELTGPGLPGDPHHILLRHPVPCSPCFRRACPIDLRCLKGIAVDEVAGAVLKVVAGDEGSRKN
jgi:lipopolysaccharide heptosyltransferase II